MCCQCKLFQTHNASTSVMLHSKFSKVEFSLFPPIFFQKFFPIILHNFFQKFFPIFFISSQFPPQNSSHFFHKFFPIFSPITLLNFFLKNPSNFFSQILPISIFYHKFFNFYLASRLCTTGGSCRGSPTRMNLRLTSSGPRQAGCRTCDASSTMHTSNTRRLNTA